MRRVYKYPLEHSNRTVIQTGNNPKIVLFDKDSQGRLCVWIDHDITFFRQMVVAVIGTGTEYDDNIWQQVATCKDMPFIWHLLLQRD